MVNQPVLAYRNAFLLSFLAIIISSGLSRGQQNIGPARQNREMSLLENFNAYRTHHLQEKLFIHTDRSVYLTGEIVWLKAYCIDGFFHRPLAVSKVAYLEVMDIHQKAILQSKIELMADGTGKGSLFLPGSISSGHYSVRAYTSWMKNGSPDLYFQQTITIVNPFTPLVPAAPGNDVQYDIQFFPEGGNLVSGLESVVGFRAADPRGQGIDFRGIIVDEKNDTLAKIKPLKFGIGRFVFTPAQGHSYRAIITHPNQKKSIYPLPTSFGEGMVVHLSETDRKTKVTVKGIFSSPTQPSTVYLLAHTRHEVIFCEAQPFRDGQAVFTLDKNSFGEGISHLTIFNDVMTPVCERLYFKKPAQELTIEVSQELTRYLPRKKVNLNLRTSLPEGGPAMANLSASVFKIDSVEESGPTIVDYLLLNSELKGNIESPDYYFEKKASGEQEEVSDNLMLTHGWIRFKWEDVLQGKCDEEYAPEHNGHILTGQVRLASIKTPASGILIYLTAAGAYTRLYSSRSDERGRVQFEMKNFYGSNELIAQTNTLFDSVYRIELVNPFSERKSGWTVPELDLTGPERKTLEQRSIHLQVQNMFYKNQRSLIRKPSFDSAAFYGPPDGHYTLDEYTRFPTMEEIMREYVRGVDVRKRKDGFHFLNYDLVNRTFFENDPLVMLDGMPVFDINKIMAFDPRQVKSLEVMNRKCYLGVSCLLRGLSVTGATGVTSVDFSLMQKAC